MAPARVLRRVLISLGLLALGFWAYISAVRLAYALLYCALLIIVGSWLWTRLGARGLVLKREGPSGAYEAGERFTEHLRVENDSLLGLPWIEVSDHAGIPGYDAGRVLSLGARRRRRWRSDGLFTARGAYVMGPLRVSTGDPFGLFQATREVRASSQVIVYPRLVDASPLLARLSGAAGDSVAVGRHVDTPPEAFGIREYNPDDGVNRIHWPSTARLGRPMSRSFEKYEGTDLLIALDLGEGKHFGAGDTSSLERAVSLAASVAMIAAGRGQAVGLVCNDAMRTNIRPGRGPHQVRRLLEVLALATDDGDADFQRTVEGALVARGEQALFVITPAASEKWIDRVAGARRGTVRTSLVRLVPGGSLRGSQKPRRMTEAAAWWDISVNDEIFSTALTTQRPTVVAEREAVG